MTPTKLANYVLTAGQAFGQDYFRLPGNHYIRVEELLYIWDIVKESVMKVDWGKRIHTSNLFDEAVWHSFVKGKKIAYGRCVKYLHDHGLLPLQLVNPGKTGKRVYVFHDDPGSVYRMIC